MRCEGRMRRATATRVGARRRPWRGCCRDYGLGPDPLTPTLSPPPPSPALRAGAAEPRLGGGARERHRSSAPATAPSLTTEALTPTLSQGERETRGAPAWR